MDDDMAFSALVESTLARAGTEVQHGSLGALFSSRFTLKSKVAPEDALFDILSQLEKEYIHLDYQTSYRRYGFRLISTLEDPGHFYAKFNNLLTIVDMKKADFGIKDFIAIANTSWSDLYQFSGYPLKFLYQAPGDTSSPTTPGFYIVVNAKQMEAVLGRDFDPAKECQYDWFGRFDKKATGLLRAEVADASTARTTGRTIASSATDIAATSAAAPALAEPVSGAAGTGLCVSTNLPPAVTATFTPCFSGPSSFSLSPSVKAAALRVKRLATACAGAGEAPKAKAAIAFAEQGQATAALRIRIPVERREAPVAMETATAFAGQQVPEVTAVNPPKWWCC